MELFAFLKSFDTVFTVFAVFVCLLLGLNTLVNFIRLGQTQERFDKLEFENIRLKEENEHLKDEILDCYKK